MSFRFSKIGQRISAGSGIEQLMDDLGHALAAGGSQMRMLGGGNPAAIPEVTALWRAEMQRLLTHEPDRFDRMLVNYDPCRGNPEFLEELVGFFNRQYGWGITTENVVVTSGGQTAFFYLFNLLAGEHADGRRKKILLPLVPEYVGYANQGFDPDTFCAMRPKIQQLDETTFKYHVDFDALNVDGNTSAICVSRPTNPTGNVLTDEEIGHLRQLADDQQIPLIVDNAYGPPFPNVVFGDATPPWGDNVVLTYSLSKLGLPGTRTGIVIGSPQLTNAISSINAIAGLANSNLGQVLVTPMLRDDRMVSVCRDMIRPFYREKSMAALSMLKEFMREGSYRVHASEGALFLWLHFPGLPITTAQLYERLKSRGVLIIPGENFFFGLGQEIDHQTECIRLTFSMSHETVREGIKILANEISSLSSV